MNLGYRDAQRSSPAVHAVSVSVSRSFSPPKAFICISHRAARTIWRGRKRITEVHDVDVTSHALDLSSGDNVRKLAGVHRRRHPREQRGRDPARPRYRSRRRHVAACLGPQGVRLFDSHARDLPRDVQASQHNVPVVGVNPGGTETDRQMVRWRARAEKELGSAERWRELTTGFPFGRLATVDEVANMIVFLCSDRSSYTTGTIITIDGGAAAKA